MIGYKLGVLFLQKSWALVHNSDRNERKKKKCDEKYSKESA